MDATMELLYKIKKRPGLYLGKRSLILLQAYSNGYTGRLKDENPQYQCNWHYDFQCYIYEKFKVPYNDDLKCYGTEYNLEYYIQQLANSDEKAFDLYFQFLDEFLESRPDLR